MKPLYQKYYEQYDNYVSPFKRFDKHNELLMLYKRYSYCFDIKQIGVSVENREIMLVKAGNGPVKILIWTQMHGDEDTATGAVFDILNFLKSDDEFNSHRKQILKKLSIYIIPMLNPDGAERWKRKNALGIDINRDALRQVSPESKTLQKIFEDIKPDYCFNMHDQESYYAANDKTPATISLLAPPSDELNTVPPTRERAIGIVCELHNMLQTYISGGVGKWSDDYEPRAFGEHFQKLGSSTILIESGGYYKDPDRKFARKLNFVSLLHIFDKLASGNKMKQNIKLYNSIPLNKKGMFFDMILKNVIINKKGYSFLCDVGLKIQNSRSVLLKVDEIGDLTPFSGYVEHDLGKTPLNEEILNKLQIVKSDSLINEF